MDASPTQPIDAPPPAAAQKRRKRRILRNILIGIVAVIAAIWLVLYITKGRFLKHPFERIVGSMTNRTVTVGGDFQLYFAPFRIKFYAERFTLSNPDWASRPNLFQADKLDTRIAPLSLIFGKRRLYWLDLVNGAVDLEWNAAHTANSWTFSDKKGGEPLEFPRIDVATVTGTSVRYLDPRMRVLANLDVADIRSVDATIGRAVGLKGTGQLRETPFTVTAQLLSPDATANRGQNKLVARMRAAGNVIDVAGTLPSIADVENVPLAVTARGANLSTLLGVIDVAIPNTRTYRLRGQLVKQGEEYHFTRITGVAGKTDLAGKLTITNGERIHLDSVLATKSLDIVDAAPFIGYNPDIVESRGAVAAAAATGAGAQRLLPDGNFPVETMQIFDADLKWTIGVVRSKNIPISNVDLTLDLERGRLALSPLTFAMARGNVASDAVFDTRSRPSAVSYDIRLAPTPMGRLLKGYGLAEAGTTGTIKGRIKLDGRGDSIHDSLASSRGRIAFVMPSGALSVRNVQLAELDIGTFAQRMFQGKLDEPVQVNCGLIGFTVRGGVAAADPILIDTRKNVIVGRGGFSFRNEAVDLAFRADSKKFSLFAGQSPVGFGGVFAAPKMSVVSKDLLARVGTGLGLALVATPVAGVLAFVDVGDAKATACGPVLAGATAKAQRTTKGETRDDVGRGTTAKGEDGKASEAEKKGQKKKFLGIF
ncbi:MULTISPECIES: AsmA family protein [Sphingomonas]|uniref:AsmA family protein n=1 Tax=Sphingomonas TaxID=13687 RepID=UPI0006F5DFE4|nr:MULTISPECIES: AsmA family protein [Sphingomonas]KQM92527.1 AsmA family protein [Sphingomonas sp. Leaf226]MDY0967869.1 AsmA family protein [Sphingomonas sp. CFBP9021]USR00653.1 AsmA family protein [Sphingomonas aerolata]